MAYTDYRNKLLSYGSRLIAAYDFNEASGNIINYGTSGPALTVTSTPGMVTRDGAELLTGATRSLNIHGADVTGTPVSSGSFASGGAMQLASQEFTYIQILQLDTFSPSGSRGLWERANHLLVRTDHTQSFRIYLYTGAGVSPELRPDFLPVLGQTFMLAITRKGLNLDAVINGAHLGRLEWPGTYSTTNTAGIAFAAGGRGIDGRIQSFAVLDKALSIGELRELAVLGRPEMDRVNDNTLWDNVLDDTHPEVAATAQATYFDSITGGKMRVGEPRRIAADGIVSRPSAKKLNRKTFQPITGTSEKIDYGNYCAQLMHELLMRASVRANTNRTVFHDGYAWISPEMAYSTGAGYVHPVTGRVYQRLGRRQYGGVGAAILARWLAGGPKGLRGIYHPNEYIKIARADLNLILTSMINYADNMDPYDNEFNLGPFGKLVTTLEGLIPDSEWTEARDVFLAATERHLLGPNFDRGSGAEIYWYVNPNRELGEHEAILAATNLYREPGTNIYQGYIDDHFNFIINPPSWPQTYGGGPGGGGGIMPAPPLPGVRQKHELVYVVTPTLADGTDGKGFIAESHGGDRGFWNIGSTVDNDSTRNTVDVGGYDPSYTQVGMNHIRGMLADGHMDMRYIRLINLMRNQLYDRLNTSTWVLDCTYGSRHTGNTKYGTTDLIIEWRTNRGFSTTTLASQFNDIVPTIRSEVGVSRQVFMGSVAGTLGGIVQCMDDYPLPV